MDLLQATYTLLVPFLLTCLTLVAFVGNIIVVLSIRKFTHLNTQFCFHIMSGLAIADICVTLVVMPWSIVYFALGYWPFGFQLCKAWMASDVMCCTASILHLGLVALDRYLAIAHPFRYSSLVNENRIRLSIILIWFTSVLISFVPIQLNWYNEFETAVSPPTTTTTTEPPPHSNRTDSMTKYQCIMKVNWIYAIISSSTSFYIPLLFICVVYVKIFWIAHKHAVQVHRLSISSKFNPSTSSNWKSSTNNSTTRLHSMTHQHLDYKHASYSKLVKQCYAKLPHLSLSNRTKMSQPRSCSSESLPNRCIRTRSSLVMNLSQHSDQPPVYEQPLRSSTRNSISWKNEMKSIKTIGLLVGCFVLCWLPFFVVYLIEPLGGVNGHWEIPFSVAFPITWIGYANSAVNPILYGFLQRDFRHAFNRPFRRVLFRIKWNKR